MKRQIIVFACVVFMAVLFSGCPDVLIRPETPVLLMRIQDYDQNPGVMSVTDVEIDRTSPGAATLTIASSLDLYSATDGGNMAGYTYELEEGASYDELRFTHGVTTVTVPLTINAAEAGMVYLVGMIF